MIRKSKQNFKNLENENTFEDEIKSNFHNFKGLSMKQINQFFLEGKNPTLRKAFLYIC